MKRKILALALFAVMVLSLIPTAPAVPIAGTVTQLELINQSKDSNKLSGNVVVKNLSGSSITLKITEDYSELTKTAQTYYEDDIAQYNMFAHVYLGELASGTDVSTPEKRLEQAKKFMRIDEITSNGKLVNQRSNVQVEGSSVPAISAKAESNADGTYSLYMRVWMGEFTTSGESKSESFTLSWPSGSGRWSLKATAQFTNTGAAAKPVKPLYVKPAFTGDDGLYNVYVTNGIVFIDYASDIDWTKMGNKAAIPLKLTFYEDANATVRVPKKREIAYVQATDTRQTNSGADPEKHFFIDSSRSGAVHYQNYVTPANSGRTLQTTHKASAYNDEATILGVWLPATRSGNTNKTMRIRVEGKDYTYQTSDIKVVFRPLPRNQITTAVLVERSLTIAVGESKKLTIESASATTYSNIRLQEINSVKSLLYIDGLTITGINVGTAQVQVTASGRVIDQITVKVVASNPNPPPTPATDSQWRVLARRLNVRTGPGTNYSVVGTALMNQILTGTDQGNGWVRLTDGRYVFKSYLSPINSYNQTGTYVVTASALNVRTGPGSSYAKATNALPKGTVVTVREIAYGWGNIGSGWVSMNYLK